MGERERQRERGKEEEEEREKEKEREKERKRERERERDRVEKLNQTLYRGTKIYMGVQKFVGGTEMCQYPLTLTVRVTRT